ncbi:hypothetical protein B4U37_19450 [Sutcliffiella horikoshii]|uniref:SGNH/GDSL hydrolase family protein n=2 Tax=Sutcliffiella horikoshii TaxID=79883 RepID=A0ABM6KNY0_9BACI|nr:hypothetical protein B4U37_19450 [Sutcliffiella horikoshii]
MGKLVISIICVLSIGVIAFGIFQYDKKIETTSEQAKLKIAETDTNVDEEKETSKPQLMDTKELSTLTANLQEPLAQKISNALEEEKKLTLVILGSQAIGEHEEGTSWTKRFVEELNASYADLFEYHIENVGTKNSSQVIEENIHEKVVTLQPDILIIEPFLLNDLGYTTMKDTLYHLDILLSTVKIIKPNVTIMLQPANPIADNEYYLDQVKELENFASENNYVYLDHWETWPSEEENTPTISKQEGQDIWASYLIKYFTNKE